MLTDTRSKRGQSRPVQHRLARGTTPLRQDLTDEKCGEGSRFARKRCGTPRTSPAPANRHRIGSIEKPLAGIGIDVEVEVAANALMCSIGTLLQRFDTGRLDSRPTLTTGTVGGPRLGGTQGTATCHGCAIVDGAHPSDSVLRAKRSDRRLAAGVVGTRPATDGGDGERSGPQKHRDKKESDALKTDREHCGKPLTFILMAPWHAQLVSICSARA